MIGAVRAPDLQGDRTAPTIMIEMLSCSDIMEYRRCTVTKATMAKTSQQALTDLGALKQAAECLKALAHPHRLRMVQMLLRGRYTVGDLAEACAIPSHMASEHLRLMQRCGFLSSKKDGRNVYYLIVELHLANLMACIEARFGKPRQ